ncbi:hypothetical protein FKM82_019490 [Ascaphus truei]
MGGRGAVPHGRPTRPPPVLVPPSYCHAPTPSGPPVWYLSSSFLPADHSKLRTYRGGETCRHAPEEAMPRVRPARPPPVPLTPPAPNRAHSPSSAMPPCGGQEAAPHAQFLPRTLSPWSPTPPLALQRCVGVNRCARE